MTNTMKKLLISLICLGLLTAGILSLSGCSDSTSDDNTLVYGSTDYTAINPALYEHGEINALIFAGLTAHNAENKVVPGLAKSWGYNKASKTYTFKLRNGLTFHDGEPLTSEDVKFTLETILNKKNQSEIVSNYKDITKIKCPDKKTVKITLKTKNEAFPDYMTIGIIPKHMLEGKNLATDSFNQNPVGAGPYKFAEWDEGQSITMEKFDDYYDGAAKIDKIIFKIADDDSSRALQLESGDLDIAQVDPTSAKNFKKKDGFTVYDMKTVDYRAIAYNFNRELFKKHRELPNILSYGIDRKAIVKSVLHGDGQVAYSPLQKGEYVNKNMEKFTYNPAKAKKLLKKNGWKKNKNGYWEKNGDELAFDLLARDNDRVRVDMANICAKQLKKIGANVTAKPSAEFDWEGQGSCIIGWGSPFDPDDHTYKIFTTEGDDNYTYYSNKNIDRILTKARKIANGSTRTKLYKDFQTEMAKDMPYTFIAYVDANYVIKDGIKGITEKTLLGHHGVGVFWNIAKWEKDAD